MNEVISQKNEQKENEAKFAKDSVNKLTKALKEFFVEGQSLEPSQVGYLMALKEENNLKYILKNDNPADYYISSNTDPGDGEVRVRKQQRNLLSFNAVFTNQDQQKAFNDWIRETKLSHGLNNLKTHQKLGNLGRNLAKLAVNTLSGQQNKPSKMHPGSQKMNRRKFLGYGSLAIAGVIGADYVIKKITEPSKIDSAAESQLEKTLFTPQEAGLAEPISPTRALVGLAGGRYTIQFDSATSKYKFVESGSSKNEKSGDNELKEAMSKIIERAGKLGLKLNDIEMLVALDLWSQAPEAVLNNDKFGFLEIYKNLTNEFDVTKTPANLLLLASVYGYINPNTQTLQIGNSNLIQLLLSQMRRHIELYRGTEMFEGFSKSPLEIPGSVSATFAEPGKIDTFYEATTIADSDFVTQLGDAALAGGAGHADFSRVMPLHTKPLKFEINNQFQILSPLPGTVVKIELGKYTNAKDSSKNGKIIPDNKVLPSGEDEVYNLRTDDWPNGHLGHRLVIQIDHDIQGYEEYGGLYMHIFHLPSDITRLKVGQKIKAGDIISIGKSYSGSGTGNHASGGFNSTTVSVGDAGANNGNNGLANGQEFTRDVVQSINLVDKNGQTVMHHPLTGKIIDRNNQTKDVSGMIGLESNKYIIDQRNKLGIKRPRYIERFDGNTKVYQK
ncbi:MAG: hypothetical protein WCK98_03365 [bacterium]